MLALGHKKIKIDQYAGYNHLVVTEQDDVVIRSAVNELTQGMEGITGRNWLSDR
uniref:hypothetical protein n=1 Tax=Paenibacillus sp. FSL L8-0436 TaxID=2954686 RepID=UPI00406CDE8A